MHQKDIEFNNENIAKFMGGQWKAKKRRDETCEYNLHIPHRPGSIYTHLNQLNYHQYWDWLMPVIDKIENLGFMSEINSMLDDNDKVYKHMCWFYRKRKKNNRDTAMESYAGWNGKQNDSKISVVYQAILNFIKEYE